MGAFKSTPLQNLLIEAGLPNIRDRRDYLTANILSRLWINSEKPLIQNIRNMPFNNFPRIPSAAYRATRIGAEIGFNFKMHTSYIPSQPPWFLKTESTITDLMCYPKSKTPPIIYVSNFKEVSGSLAKTGWTTIYTDGSKTATHTSYAVVNNNHQIDTLALINPNCSIFTAESEAILAAANICKHKIGKFIICSDSYSAIQAINNINHKDETISKIRNLLIQNQNKIKIMWVPSHVGILGNEKADEAAANASRRPLLFLHTFNKKDIKKNIKNHYQTKRRNSWVHRNNFYKSLNPLGTAPHYPITSKQDLKIFIRLRLGHSRLTHSHLMEGRPPYICHLCNEDELTASHLINQCEYVKNKQHQIFGKICFNELLREVNTNNVKNTIKLIRSCNLYYKI